jgi:hypothetical protein
LIRIGLLIIQIRDEHHDRNGERFQTLVRSDRVELQRNVGQYDKSTESDRHGQHLRDGYLHMLIDLRAVTDQQPEERDHEMYARQGHVREAVLDIDVLVDLNDEYGGEHVDGQADRNNELVQSRVEPSHYLHNLIFFCFFLFFFIIYKIEQNKSLV